VECVLCERPLTTQTAISVGKGRRARSCPLASDRLFQNNGPKLGMGKRVGRVRRRRSPSARLSSFRVWKKERDRGTELQQKLQAYKRWEFHAEFVGASRTVYTYENGTSPSLSVWIQARVNNRNSKPTTIFPHSLSVQLKDTIDQGFQRPTIFPGTILTIPRSPLSSK
jgi:hypothetical protein